MALQLSVTAQNDRLDAFETTVGSSGVTLEIRTGAQPATCATGDAGTLLATCDLPADWMAAASGGTKALSGSWLEAAAVGDGTAGHFRIKDGASTCHMQGSAGAGSEDLVLDNAVIATGQQVTITAFTLTEAND